MAHDLIDFVGLAAALLQQVDALMLRWLPNGVERNGRWYVGDFDGSPGESANVNLATGQWIDNAAPDTDCGGDLTSLYARIRGLNNGQAARDLIRDIGWAPVQTPVRGAAPPASSIAAQAGLTPAVAAERAEVVAKRRTVWRAVVPVPPNAPAPDFKWGYRDKKSDVWFKLDAVRSWAYEFEGQRFGHVARFERISSSGEIVKDTLPRTWCVDESDGRGTMQWRWKQWEVPRPLYVPATLLSGDPGNVPVVIVEGEKCAEAGFRLIGHEFDFVCWPGGCKAWAMAHWGWLMGRTVYLWPDCDAKRKALTKAEREAGADPMAKPLLPEHQQPGMQAMVNIGSMLVADHGCTVHLCRIPAPGDVADGWDIADAIDSGWDAVRVRDFIRAAGVFVPPDDAARAKAAPISTPSTAGAATDEEATAWRSKLIKSGGGAITKDRENLVLALDGMRMPDGRVVLGVPEAQGLIAFNEFTNDVIKTRDTPWGTAAGVWDEVDELEMGNWLTREHWLPSMPRGTLEEAVAMVAKRHRYHPVRDEFNCLQGTWDGTKRLGTWVRRSCLEEDEWDGADPLQQYLARVGTWLMMAVCARVLTPGCKFDYMVIFEGAQGVGKSTLARLLGGEFFADTGLVLGDKDSYQNLQGILVYEWGELDSLNKSEVTKVKQFISSMKDRFRASFDRRAKDYPRQCVFIGTTNEDHYLVDPTGNRRMWPVRVTRQIDTEWFRENRAQLFAEALHYLAAGERFHPTPREQRDLFEPQQQQRQIENAIQAAVMRYLYDENQRVSVHSENGTLVNQITAQELLSKLGISVDKQTHVILRQVTAALRQAGWVRFRSTRGDRPWMFRRPDMNALQAEARGSDGSNRPTQGNNNEVLDECPF